MNLTKDFTPPSTPPSPTSHNLSDVFSESPRASDSYSSFEVSELPSLRAAHVTAGYREGVSEAKEKFLQAGFDDGYCFGAKVGVKAGYMIGVLEGLVNSCKTSHHPQGRKLENLMSVAIRELDVNHVLGDEFFTESGACKYEMGTTLRAGTKATEHLISNHPMLQKWEAIIQEYSCNYGIGHTDPKGVTGTDAG